MMFFHFQVLGSLVHVSMPQNGINPDGICSLAQALSKNTNLEVLNLQCQLLNPYFI